MRFFVAAHQNPFLLRPFQSHRLVKRCVPIFLTPTRAGSFCPDTARQPRASRTTRAHTTAKGFGIRTGRTLFLAACQFIYTQRCLWRFKLALTVSYRRLPSADRGSTVTHPLAEEMQNSLTTKTVFGSCGPPASPCCANLARNASMICARSGSPGCGVRHCPAAWATTEKTSRTTARKGLHRQHPVQSMPMTTPFLFCGSWRKKHRAYRCMTAYHVHTFGQQKTRNARKQRASGWYRACLDGCLVPATGIELVTYALRVRCSTY